MNQNANQIWVDKRNEFYHRSMKLFLHNNGIQHIIKENLLLLGYS